MKKNILICLEKLDIGGVETFVYNQALSFLKQGHTVYILSDEGIYTTKLKSKGISIINHKYKLENGYDVEGAKKVSNILIENKIDEVHIHQYPCLLAVMEPVIKNKIPYVAYIHSIVDGVFEWFIQHYKIYEELFNIYFQNASKIIAITNNTCENFAKFFNIDKNRCCVINNCIDFSNIETLENITNIERFLIVSRLSSEKKVSIENAITLVDRYGAHNKNITLDIIGDGPILTNLKNFIKEKNINLEVNFLGASDDVTKQMLSYDVVLGVDRCILEALATKRIAIISGYNGLKGIVHKDNINIAMLENFSGNNMSNVEFDSIINELQNLKDPNEIVNSNYLFVKQNLDINNQNYTVDDNDCNYWNLDLLLNMHSKYIELFNINFELEEKKYHLGQELLNLKKEIELKDKEINDIKKSKRWQYINKILYPKDKYKGGK